MTFAAQLTKYILAAMLAWVPINNQTIYGETEAEVRTRYESTALDIVMSVLAPNEPWIFKESNGVKEALELASIASFEGGFQTFVEDGSCNQKGYTPDGRGGCDGGHAFSNWQIHVYGNGYILQEDGGLTSVDAENATAKRLNRPVSYSPEDVIQGKSLIEDHRLAARLALHLVRISWKSAHSLCGFTGEDCGEPRNIDGHLVGGHPKASQRHQRAIDYERSHPFVPEPDAAHPFFGSFGVVSMSFEE